MTARLSFRNLFARTPRTARKPAPPRARLGLEALEDRTTPSVTVVAWGDNAAGQASVPAGLADVTEVAAGIAHSLAVKSDGTVVAWGDNAFGRASVPAGLSGVVHVAAGGFHNLAVKSDGTVVAWGDNASGQASVPAGLSDVTEVAAGVFHNLAVKSDGTVVAWGSNRAGQASVPAGLSDVTEVAAGIAHSLAIVANRQPTNIALTNSSIAENQPSGTTVGAFSTTDPRQRRHLHLRPRVGDWRRRQRLVHHRRQPAEDGRQLRLRGEVVLLGPRQEHRRRRTVHREGQVAQSLNGPLDGVVDTASGEGRGQGKVMGQVEQVARVRFMPNQLGGDC